MGKCLNLSVFSSITMKSYVYIVVGGLLSVLSIISVKIGLFYCLFYDPIVVDTHVFEIYALESNGLDLNDHYAVTLICTGDDLANELQSCVNISKSIADYLTSISDIVPSSMNVLKHNQISFKSGVTLLTSDIVEELTHNSHALWNRDYCRESLPCENLILVVHDSSYNAIVDDMFLSSTNDSFLWSLGGASWGLFSLVDSGNLESIDRVQTQLLLQLSRSLQLPQLENGKGTCSEDCDVQQIQTRELQWTVLKNSLTNINQKVKVVHSLFIERNALLWYDVIASAEWLQEYRRLMVVLVSLDEDLASLDFKGSVSLDIIDRIKEATRIVSQLHDDPDSRFPPIHSSRLAIEEYFAVFAPFWLPIIVPVVKSVKLLLSM